MTGARTKQGKPELRVVFDTSVLYTGSASDLLNQETCEVIRGNSAHADLTMLWYLPAIVRHERQYQMLSAALKLLPHVQKLERLLGHNLNITEKAVEHLVADAVELQLQKAGLNVVELRVAEVDWEHMMLAAAYRREPFDPGEREKGFRDALVAESFLQIVRDSPVTPKICRVAFVSGDTLLRAAVANRTSDCKNVRVLDSLESLRGLVNTLVAEVSEEFVAGLSEQAAAFFFTKDDKNCLYRKERVGESITATYAGELQKVPDGAQRSERNMWFIGGTRFVKKVRQRVTWVTTIIAKSKAFATQQTLGSVLPTSLLTHSPSTPFNYADQWKALDTQAKPSQASTLSTILASGGQADLGPEGRSQLSSLMSFFSQAPGPERHVADGLSTFEVTWSVVVSTSHQLTTPRIEDIRFTQTVWHEAA
ncbi:MAG: hypothetical protein ACHQQS_05500 [Thermoanaerobaculales bacterium]